jgi:hypothetical protein
MNVFFYGIAKKSPLLIRANFLLYEYHIPKKGSYEYSKTLFIPYSQAYSQNILYEYCMTSHIYR